MFRKITIETISPILVHTIFQPIELLIPLWPKTSTMLDCSTIVDLMVPLYPRPRPHPIVYPRNIVHTYTPGFTPEIGCDSFCSLPCATWCELLIVATSTVQ
ncbi:hypothetical protein BRADI_2g42997v3 [Brachypodium distachyon]|uniref:Uncharacterized protein n=1 Tax=Brachypodium distachyon TaxID=15368 RepID=A0A0Q3IS32_BRADI|nr:hypothetical protein BRADI_2g42997v3 [Brachypodium distachyon]